MTHTDWIGDRYVSTLGLTVLEDLADIGGRLGGSDSEHRAHERVRDAFEAAGVRDVHFQEFDLQGWEREGASLDLSEPAETSLECIALPGSPGGRIDGELVHLGYGLPSDFEDRDCSGAIVVARSDVPDYHDRWIHRREKYFRACEAGAAAFLFQNHVEGQLQPTGSVGGGTDVVGPIPAAGVSKEAGERIARYAADGPVRGTVDVRTRVGDATSRNVVGRLGPDTDEEILVSAHVDGHDISEGALDNASGVAVACEVAAALAASEDQLETAVRLVGFGSEEFGLIGSQHYADAADTESVRAIVNCDGIARGRDLLAITCGFDGITDAVEEVATEFRHPITVDPAVATHSDHWPFVWRGIPGVMLMSDTGPGRGWGHTAADTLDKTDPRAVRDHAILVTRLVHRLAESDRAIDRRSTDAIRDELIDDEKDISMRVAGDWPFDA